MKRHPLIAFFGVCFLISWGIWVPILAAAYELIRLPAWFNRWLLIGSFGPGLAALLVTLWLGGIPALRKLYERLLIWRVGFHWYVIALLLPAVLSLLITAVHMMFGGDAPNFAEPRIREFQPGRNPWLLLAPFFLLQLITGNALSEEMGWRAFVLPRWQQKYSALVASMFIALIWPLWGAPFLWLQTGEFSPWRVLFMFLGTLPAAILSTWIFNSTKGSLLVIVLFNQSMKVTDVFLATPATLPFVPVMAFWLVAVVVLAFAGPKTLCRQPLVENCGGKPEPAPPPNVPATSAP